MMHVKYAEQVNVRKLLHTDECYIYLLLELCDRVNSNCDLWEYLDLIFDQLSDLSSQILEFSLPKKPSIPSQCVNNLSSLHFDFRIG